MAILYSLVARGSVVLAEMNTAGAATNARTVARQVLEKIPISTETNVSYSQDRHVFHVKRTDGITVLCVADETAGRRIPFSFLEDIHLRFVKAFGGACHTAPAYAMNDEFSRILNQKMDYFSNDPTADRMNRIKGEMNQVRTVMLDNIDKVLARGERLELLVDKTASMHGNTVRFKKQSRRFNNTVRRQNLRLTVILVLVILLIIYAMLVSVCQGITLPSCLT